MVNAITGAIIGVSALGIGITLHQVFKKKKKSHVIDWDMLRENVQGDKKASNKLKPKKVIKQELQEDLPHYEVGESFDSLSHGMGWYAKRKLKKKLNSNKIMLCVRFELNNGVHRQFLVQESKYNSNFKFMGGVYIIDPTLKFFVKDIRNV